MDDSKKKTIGFLSVKYRIDRKMNQNELAKKIGISVCTLSLAEHGKMSAKTAIKILNFLDK